MKSAMAAGSSFTTGDTKELLGHFGHYPGARPGLGYPMGKLLGIIDLTTGLFAALVACPELAHDMGMVASVQPFLSPGDVLLGGRAFCSFAHFALLQQLGVLACCRLHHARKVGAGRRRDRWRKDRKPPS